MDWTYDTPPKQQRTRSPRQAPASQWGDGRGGFGQSQSQMPSQPFEERWTPSQPQQDRRKAAPPDELWTAACKLRSLTDRRAEVHENAQRRHQATLDEIKHLQKRAETEEKDILARGLAHDEACTSLKDVESRLAERDGTEEPHTASRQPVDLSPDDSDRPRHIMCTANPDVKWLLGYVPHLKMSGAVASQTQPDSNADQAAMAVDQAQCLTLLNEADHIEDEDEKQAQRKQVLERFAHRGPPSMRYAPYS
jgi:hypothetical protein